MNEVSYNTLIDACCRDKDVSLMQDAEKLIQEIKKGPGGK